MLNRLKYLILIVILLPAFFSCQEEDRRQIPISDFFKTPDKSFLKISPDGKYLSYLKPYKDRQNLFIQSLEDGKERMATSFTDNPVRDYFWTFNNQLVFSQDVTEMDEVKMYALDVNTLQVRTLLSQTKTRIRLLNRSRQNPDVVTIIMNKRNPATFDVYRLNVKTNELTLYITNPGNITEWYTDNNGKILLAKASDGVDETILFRSNEQAQFKPIIKNNFKNKVDPVAFTNTGNTFYALSNVNRDKSALVEINALTGREQKVIYATDKADIMDVGYSRNKRRLEYAGWEDAKPHKHFLNTEAGNMFSDLKKKLSNGAVKFVDRDTAETKFVITTYTDRNPGTSYLYEKSTGKLTQLSNLNTSFKPEELCAMKPVSFKAGDGLLINGYLTLPLGDKDKDLPVVVMPHDGPWNRNNWGYSAEVQFLANRGYAVFQINYRGSTGYGKKFMSAGFKQVGGKIQSDINDGVQWLIKEGIADPKKIAIMGARFGGFSALYGMSFHPKTYNCAIVQYGLINFFNYLKDVPPFLKPRLQMTYEMVGNPETDADVFRAISPVFHADKIKSPLLIFQGAKDPRANISELNQFVRALQKNNVSVKYVLKDNERNFFKSEHNRMAMYTDIEKFLSTHMKVKP
ncbi:S9 family peptidase [Mucilaginibacter aquatilis]|uniref:Prolyl oligopeptidase family serine peptidase n=1 Tax=Mucilaginibacter aquatilis TaxID=1517760 RepID=A0A6I4I9U5_9SPHI|nr:prolyl oligopeptidase family serine peptidase [Mucilaginibacter aquatilis]MVN90246.1 prolyl oligopeptidase family serine peptidase [Mucilaginibacter aquatilis]